MDYLEESPAEMQQRAIRNRARLAEQGNESDRLVADRIAAGLPLQAHRIGSRYHDAMCGMYDRLVSVLEVTSNKRNEEAIGDPEDTEIARRSDLLGEVLSKTYGDRQHYIDNGYVRFETRPVSRYEPLGYYKCLTCRRTEDNQAPSLRCDVNGGPHFGKAIPCPVCSPEAYYEYLTLNGQPPGFPDEWAARQAVESRAARLHGAR